MTVNKKSETIDRDFRPRPKRRKRVFRLRNILILLIVAGVVAGFVQLGLKYQASQKEVERLSNPEEAVKQETINLKNRVSELVEAPKEDPKILNVQDVSKLQGQAFYKNAQNGDRLLIYVEAKKAILYRPSTDKIIEVAPVNIGNDQVSPKTESTTTGTTPAQ